MPKISRHGGASVAPDAPPDETLAADEAPQPPSYADDADTPGGGSPSLGTNSEASSPKRARKSGKNKPAHPQPVLTTENQSEADTAENFTAHSVDGDRKGKDKE